MANISKEELGLPSELRKREPVLKAGGVLSLNSYLAITKPEILEKIEGEKAIVEAKELDDGKLYLFIKLPLIDNSYEELRVWVNGTLEEGDEVWISSIVALFLVNTKGETTVRFDARCDEKQKPKSIDDLNVDIFERCTNLMLSSKRKGPTINIIYELGKCPEGNYSLIANDNDTTLKINESNTWRIIRLNNYKNARPLTNGLIIAEKSEVPDSRHGQVGIYDILYADGAIFCSNVHRVYYGQNFLNCLNHLWLFNKENHSWEEKQFDDFSIVQGAIGENLIGVYKKTNLYKGERVFKKNDKKYFFINYYGDIKLEIEDGWVISRGFHNGVATIRNNYNDELVIYRTIDTTGCVLEENEVYNHSISHKDDVDKDNWDAMTDGMYGDYPEEGYDGDYESLGF